MKQTSKKAKLLGLLGKKWVTPLVSLQEAGIHSLSQRVTEWERQGIEFNRRWVTVGGSRFMSYRRKV